MAAAAVAKLGIKAHAHILRHACGFNWQTTGSIPIAEAYLATANLKYGWLYSVGVRPGSRAFGGTDATPPIRDSPGVCGAPRLSGSSSD